MIFEIFRQERRGQAFAHAGSIEAPDLEFAEAWAREQYGRRQESEAAVYRAFATRTSSRCTTSRTS